MHRVIHCTKDVIVLTVAQKRYEITVLLPNSDLQRGNNKRDADGSRFIYDGRSWWVGSLSLET